MCMRVMSGVMYLIEIKTVAYFKDWLASTKCQRTYVCHVCSMHLGTAMEHCLTTIDTERLPFNECLHVAANTLINTPNYCNMAACTDVWFQTTATKPIRPHYCLQKCIVGAGEVKRRVQPGQERKQRNHTNSSSFIMPVTATTT